MQMNRTVTPVLRREWKSFYDVPEPVKRYEHLENIFGDYLPEDMLLLWKSKRA